MPDWCLASLANPAAKIRVSNAMSPTYRTAGRWPSIGACFMHHSIDNIRATNISLVNDERVDSVKQFVVSLTFVDD